MVAIRIHPVRLTDRVTRNMDMLNADLHMKNELTAKKQLKKSRSANVDDDAGFHFIAYVPVDDHVWKLDGLERQPQKLGTHEIDHFSIETSH